MEGLLRNMIQMLEQPNRDEAGGEVVAEYPVIHNIFNREYMPHEDNETDRNYVEEKGGQWQGNNEYVDEQQEGQYDAQATYNNDVTRVIKVEGAEVRNDVDFDEQEEQGDWNTFDDV